MLRRFWFEFNKLNDEVLPPGVSLGCGVSAFDIQDAKNLIDKKIFKGGHKPPVAKIIEDVDVRELDQGHVIPNMKSPSERGIWFPLGFD